MLKDVDIPIIGNYAIYCHVDKPRFIDIFKTHLLTSKSPCFLYPNGLFHKITDTTVTTTIIIYIYYIFIYIL